MACKLNKQDSRTFRGNKGDSVQIKLDSDSGNAFLVSAVYAGQSFSAPWSFQIVAGPHQLLVLVEDRFQQSSITVVDNASLPGSDAGPNDPSVQKVTAELGAVPISEALSVDQANTLARSALIDKDPARALRAASIATNKDPKDAQAQLNYAVALSLVNSASPLVLSRLKTACDLIPSDLDPKSREDMFNTLVYTALYQDPPQGYEAAIQYGEEFTKASRPRKASIWINLACAYGQQYAWLKRQTNVDATVSSDAANNAVHAIQQALAIEPATKTRFQQLADPTNYDSDLSELATDNTQVQALLGLTPSSTGQSSKPAATPAEPTADPQGHS